MFVFFWCVHVAIIFAYFCSLWYMLVRVCPCVWLGGGANAMEWGGSVAEGDMGVALPLLVHGLGASHASHWAGCSTHCPTNGP